jgi:hypothetical protein
MEKKGASLVACTLVCARQHPELRAVRRSPGTWTAEIPAQLFSLVTAFIYSDSHRGNAFVMQKRCRPSFLACDYATVRLQPEAKIAAKGAIAEDEATHSSSKMLETMQTTSCEACCSQFSHGPDISDGILALEATTFRPTYTFMCKYYQAAVIPETVKQMASDKASLNHKVSSDRPLLKQHDHTTSLVRTPLGWQEHNVGCAN